MSCPYGKLIDAENFCGTGWLMNKRSLSQSKVKEVLPMRFAGILVDITLLKNSVFVGSFKQVCFSITQITKNLKIR